jgi:hypothetical protein
LGDIGGSSPHGSLNVVARRPQWQLSMLVINRWSICRLAGGGGRSGNVSRDPGQIDHRSCIGRRPSRRGSAIVIVGA